MPTPEIIHFSKLRGPYKLLPNFAPTPVEIDEVAWPSTEAYYQAQKFHSMALQETIRTCATAWDAAKCGRSNQDRCRADWPEIKLEVMRTALRAKAKQHPEVAALLIGTGNALLVEKSAHDAFWGDGPDGNGLNHLGKLWMVVRDELLGVRPIEELTWPDRVLLPVGEIGPKNVRLRELIHKKIQNGQIPQREPILIGHYCRRVTTKGVVRIPSAWLPRWDDAMRYLGRKMGIQLPAISPMSEWRVSVFARAEDKMVVLEPQDAANRGDLSRGYGEWVPGCYRGVVLARNGFLKLPPQAQTALGPGLSEVVLCGNMILIRVFSPSDWERSAGQIQNWVIQSKLGFGSATSLVEVARVPDRRE